ncbi:hypothetical protein [Nocardioides montaniterrae]
MSVDTEIQGSPADIEGASDFLRHHLAPKLDQSVDDFNNARQDADASWDSAAGREFSGLMKRARGKASDLHSATTSMAGDLDTFAAALRRCQHEMANVRTTATKAGLTVSGFLVQDPGPSLPRPAQRFTGTADQVDQYNADVTAYNAQQKLVNAYVHASVEASRIDHEYAAACRALQDQYTLGAHASWIVTLGDILGKAGEAAIGVNIGLKQSALHKTAQGLLGEVKSAIDDLNAHPERYVKRKWGFLKTLDEDKLNADRLALEGKLNKASQLLDEAGELHGPKIPKIVGKFGKVLGPLGLGIGIYNDYEDGESPAQIATSQGVSFLAGMGAGAAVGAGVGSVVPVAGTAVGAVAGAIVGAGVSIFSDGVIDSMFENGPDVGAALDEGVGALEDTGGAIADGVGKLGGAIGGLFD